MSTYQDRARKVLVSLVTNFAEKDEQGEWWGHDTDLGNQEEAFDQALSELASIVEDIIPQPSKHGEFVLPSVREGYRLAAQEMRDQLSNRSSDEKRRTTNA